MCISPEISLKFRGSLNLPNMKTEVFLACSEKHLPVDRDQDEKEQRERDGA